MNRQYLNRIAKRIILANTNNYKYIYLTIQGVIKKVFQLYTMQTVRNSNSALSDADYWQADKNNSKDPYASFAKKNIQKIYLTDVKDTIDSESAFDDDNKLKEFVKTYWDGFCALVKKKPKMWERFLTVKSVIGVRAPGDSVNTEHSAADVVKWLLTISVTAKEILKPDNLDKEECITTFASPASAIKYHIYFVYNKNDDIIIVATAGDSVIFCKIAVIGALAHNPNYTEQQNRDNAMQQADAILQTYADVEKDIIIKIKSNGHDDEIASQDNETIKKMDNKSYTRTINEYNLKSFCSGFLAVDKQKLEVQNEAIWDNEQDEKKKMPPLKSTEAVPVSIKIGYSYIDDLHKIISLCIKEKVKYTFKRITAAIKNRLIRTAIINNDIKTAFDNLFHINNKLVATYYYKALPVGESEQLDENKCAGIILQINQKFLTLPSSAYSQLTIAKNELDRLRSNTSKFTQFKNLIKDTVQIVTTQNSIADLVNYGRDSDSNIFNYIANKVRGVKLFDIFTPANNFMKQFTNAQFIKCEPEFSQYESETEIDPLDPEETIILELTVYLASHNTVYHTICNYVQKNKDHIIDVNITKDQLTKVPQGV